MNVITALIGLLALVLVALRLARLVTRDGLGLNPAPRSHTAELGTWADRELRR